MFRRNADLAERSGLCRDGREQIAVAGEVGSGHLRLQSLRGGDSALGHLGLDCAGFDDDYLDAELGDLTPQGVTGGLQGELRTGVRAIRR